MSTIIIQFPERQTIAPLSGCDFKYTSIHLFFATLPNEMVEEAVGRISRQKFLG